MLNENLSINITPGGVPVVIHISQYDIGLRTFVFTPYTTEGTFTADSAASATLEGTKPDGNAFVHNCSYNSSTGVITYTVQDQLAAVAGKVWSKLVIRNMSGNAIGYAAIIWVVDMAGVQDGAIMSDSDISALQEFVNEFGSINAYRGALNGALAAVGGPLVAATAAAMTDTTKVYVYTGSETGYTSGHWYYWNGSAWTDGGVYQSTGINTDKTLTVADMAADAKATGDAVTELKNDLDNIRERSYNLVDCNDASKWVPISGKDVTVTIPYADTVRIKSNISQTYAAARYPIDTTGINSLYVALGSYTGTGQARARLYGDNSGTSINLGTITAGGNVFNVSAYNTCWIDLCGTVGTASDGYIDYSRIIAAASDTAVTYVPYYTYKIDSALADIDELKTNAEESNAEINKLNDATFITSYNLVDCNSAENWHAENNKDVTVTIPSDDTVRITSNVSQTYAAAYYPLDTSEIDTLFCSIAGYSGTGVSRVRLFGNAYGGTPAPVSLGTITVAGNVFDISAYDNCFIEINATTGTAGTGYMDYTGILAADSSVQLPYKPYADGTESKADSALVSVEAVEKATAPYGNKLYMIHRGARITAPENTMPAFILARELGFKYIETDVRYTSDMVAVLLHDGTINRTARNADGSVISETINIADITYAQALTYDFGIAAGEKYRGTKIPTLAEFLHWCKATGTIPVLEQKIRNGAELNGVISALIAADITEDFVSLSQTTGSLNIIHGGLPRGRFLLLNNTGITTEVIQDFLNYSFLEAIVGNYTTFTSEAIDNCRNAGVKLYAHDYYNYSDIYATDDYVSGYIVEEGAI